MKHLLGIAALCGVLALGACSNNESAGTAAGAKPDASAEAQSAKPEAVASAVDQAEPDYPQPTVIVPPKSEEQKPGDDQDAPQEVPAQPDQDYQLLRAVDLLRGISLYQKAGK